MAEGLGISANAVGDKVSGAKADAGVTEANAMAVVALGPVRVTETVPVAGSMLTMREAGLMAPPRAVATSAAIWLVLSEPDADALGSQKVKVLLGRLRTMGVVPLPKPLALSAVDVVGVMVTPLPMRLSRAVLRFAAVGEVITMVTGMLLVLPPVRPADGWTTWIVLALTPSRVASTVAKAVVESWVVDPVLVVEPGLVKVVVGISACKIATEVLRMVIPGTLEEGELAGDDVEPGEAVVEAVATVVGGVPVAVPPGETVGGVAVVAGEPGELVVPGGAGVAGTPGGDGVATDGEEVVGGLGVAPGGEGGEGVAAGIGAGVGGAARLADTVRVRGGRSDAVRVLVGVGRTTSICRKVPLPYSAINCLPAAM
jgi:hypothetical protein